jgi:hypothetical protein
VYSLDELREAADQADRELEAQISDNEENLAVVRALEESYDAMVAERGEDGQVSELTGDEIAAQVEKFLAEMDARGRDAE